MKVYAMIDRSIMLALFACTLGLPAQTITIRLLEAKSGHVLGLKNVAVDEVGELTSVEVLTDKNGIGHWNVPKGLAEVSFRPGLRTDKEPYRISYLNCNVHANQPVAIADIFRYGYLPGNDCGKATTTVHPGEVVFWAKTRAWWQPDFQ